MSCKHTDGFDWSHAKLDMKNGGWKVKCLACGSLLTVRRLATPAEVQRSVLRNGPKVHKSKKERLALRREAKNA